MSKNSYFLDFEFIENGPDYPIEMISIGLVCDDGREYYAVSSEFNPENASDWVRENVLKKLDIPKEGAKTRKEIAQDIIKFVGKEKPVFYAYYGDYDWVVFCQLFGTMMDLPENFPKFCMDIKQIAVELGNPELPEQDSTQEHNALSDAKHNLVMYKFLIKYKFSGGRYFNLKDFLKKKD